MRHHDDDVSPRSPTSSLAGEATITDQALVEQMTRGDQGALRLLMQKYASRLAPTVKSVLGSVGSDQDIEEVLSDTFLRVWDSCETYEPTRASVATWLTRTVYFRARTHRKRLIRFQNSQEALLHELSALEKLDANSPDELGDDAAANLLRVLDSLRQTSPIDAEIVARRYFKEQSPSDIARDLGMSPELTRVRLHRALKKIRGALESRTQNQVEAEA